ncbi:AAA family ATPase [Wolbachia endosymbiont (group B) of Xanthorhoe designata]|uniref:AAA family ATPase n=2 Tax=unclassified Wolbachia TaxID=2640676 RepID=UPI0033421B67
MIIYLIGFPGSGKLTIAKELCNIIDGVIVDNNLFNNIIFDMIDFRNAEVTSEIWEKIFVIRENMLAILEKHHIESKHYIFTNELIKGDYYDQRVYKSVVNLSKKMNVEILPVVLYCNSGELVKRVQSKGRERERKITDSDFAMRRIKEKKLFVPQGSLKIDNSNLSAKEVAKKIVEKMNSKKVVGTSMIDNLAAESICD